VGIVTCDRAATSLMVSASKPSSAISFRASDKMRSMRRALFSCRVAWPRAVMTSLLRLYRRGLTAFFITH